MQPARRSCRQAQHSGRCQAIPPFVVFANEAGGILGGISRGQDIVVTLAVKPTPSIRLPRRSIVEDPEPYAD